MDERLVNELKTGFLVGNCLDINKATAALAEAISKEFKPVTESTINATWESVVEMEDFEYMVEMDGRTIVGIPLLFKRYACFMSALGENLGFEIDENMMSDDWITKAMPKTRAIASALMVLTVDYLSEASADMKTKTGASPAEVFIQSSNSGESYDQSLVRLSNANKGLQVVKPEDQ